MANHFLLSFLARQHLLLREKFVERHPHPWLVWEPQGGTPEAASDDVNDTWSPGKSVKHTVSQGDALCFELAVSAKEPARYYVGRSDDGELLIASAEPPRHFCQVSYAGDWLVGASPGMTAMEVSGDPLAPGIEVPLLENAVLDLDGLRLVFVGPAAFAQQVADAAAKL